MGQTYHDFSTIVGVCAEAGASARRSLGSFVERFPALVDGCLHGDRAFAEVGFAKDGVDEDGMPF